MEDALEAMRLPTGSDAQLHRMNEALIQQGEALQEVGRTFSQTGGKGEAAVSPLLVQAMEHAKVASLGSLHFLAAQAEVLQGRDRPAFINVTMAFLEICDWHQIAVAPKYELLLNSNNLDSEAIALDYTVSSDKWLNSTNEHLRTWCIRNTNSESSTCPDHVGDVCHKFSQACISDERALDALLPLRTAAFRMRGNASTLTPVHPEFLQCCIMAKCYSLGARFMDDQPIFGVDPKTTGLTPMHFVRYFYYGGIVYIGTKRWKDALDSFLMLVTAPANSLSALVVEGYKKMMLVSLIVSGTMPVLPKYASNVVTRQLKGHTSEYQVLGTRCQAGDIKGLNAAALEGCEVFKQDGNVGLVKQVVDTLTRRKIMQLTYTYMTLSLKDISEKVGLQDPGDGEGYILKMVESGDIRAKIEAPAGTVHFLEDLHVSSSATVTSRLEADLQTTADLTERVRKLEARLMTNPVFIQKMSGDHSMQGPGLSGPAGYWDEIGMGD